MVSSGRWNWSQVFTDPSDAHLDLFAEYLVRESLLSPRCPWLTSLGGIDLGQADLDCALFHEHLDRVPVCDANDLASERFGFGGEASATARLLLRLPTRIHFSVVASGYLDHFATEHVVAVIRDRDGAAD
jgi:hypothetical protein